MQFFAELMCKITKNRVQCTSVYLRLITALFTNRISFPPSKIFTFALSKQTFLSKISPQTLRGTTHFLSSTFKKMQKIRILADDKDFEGWSRTAINGTIHWSGFYLEILKDFFRCCNDLEPVIIDGAEIIEQEFGFNATTNPWSYCIRLLDRGKVDICALKQTVTDERLKLANFITPNMFYEEWVSAVVESAGESEAGMGWKHYFKFTLALEKEVWFLWILGLFVLALMLVDAVGAFGNCRKTWSVFMGNLDRLFRYVWVEICTI